MTKEEILNTDAWKAIEDLNEEERGIAISEWKHLIEKKFNVKIERRAFTQLDDIKDDMISLSIMDRFKGMCELVVLIPNAQST